MKELRIPGIGGREVPVIVRASGEELASGNS
jgi:hypothetical protein